MRNSLIGIIIRRFFDYNGLEWYYPELNSRKLGRDNRKNSVLIFKEDE